MGKVFERGDDTFEWYQPLMGKVLELLQRDFQVLANLDVKVMPVMVYHAFDEGEEEVPTKPALVKDGCPCAAKIKVLNAEARACLGHDVKLTIDKVFWDTATDRQREAVLFHELYHLDVVRDRNGAIKIQPDGRPRLRCRPDGFHVWGFYEVITRYGDDAQETAAIKRLVSHPSVHMLVDAIDASAVVSGNSIVATYAFA